MLHAVAVILMLLSVRSHGEEIFFACEQFGKIGGFELVPKPLVVGLAVPVWQRKGMGVTFARPVDHPALVKTFPVVAEELQLYPKSLFEKADIRQVVLCTEPHTGSLFSPYYVGGLAAYQNKTILLDARLEVFEVAHGLHHEIFHFIDQGTGYDPEWISLNETGTVYVGNDLTALMAYSRRNFVSAYSSKSVIEDKAEVFAFLIREPYNMEIAIRDSEVIRRKTECIKRRVQMYCPEINEAFWAKVKEHAPMYSSSISIVHNNRLTDPKKALNGTPFLGLLLECQRIAYENWSSPLGESVLGGLIISLFFLPWLILAVLLGYFFFVKAKPITPLG